MKVEQPKDLVKVLNKGQKTQDERKQVPKQNEQHRNEKEQPKPAIYLVRNENSVVLNKN